MMDSTGSPPHTRGAQNKSMGRGGTSRFIPAYAGNAAAVQRRADAESVHPRIRGERPADIEIGRMSVGSSPHTRGTLIRIHPDTDRRRFIPAYAGNASATQPTAGETPVHPRMRGEREGCCASAQLSSGSSPHARGTLVGRDHDIARNRFIPACAGNASAVNASRRH